MRSIYGEEIHPGYNKSAQFNESVSDIIACFPYDSINEELEQLRKKDGNELNWGIENLYERKIKPIIIGFFGKILKVTEIDSDFFKNEENLRYFNQLKTKCINYLRGLACVK